MLTRGHFLGQIIDDLSNLCEQAAIRNRLGYTDLSVYAENFFRDVLNSLLGLKLVNLNEDKQNESGLDLADKKARWAIQVTATPTSEKINNTLEKITDAQIRQYDHVKVLIVGKKQKTYSALDATLCKKVHGFKAKDIWDVHTLARKAVALEITELQRLHTLVSRNSARIRIELELPDEEGNFKTTGFDKWEALLKPKLGNGDLFRKYCEKIGQTMSTAERKSLNNALAKLANELSRLPRITREFFSVLLERREQRRSPRMPTDTLNTWVSYPKARRMYNGPDFDDELEILEEAGLLSINRDCPEEYGAAEIQIQISKNDDLAGAFFEFIKVNGFNVKHIVGAIDFSDF